MIETKQVFTWDKLLKSLGNLSLLPRVIDDLDAIDMNANSNYRDVACIFDAVKQKGPFVIKGAIGGATILADFFKLAIDYKVTIISQSTINCDVKLFPS